MHGAAHDADIAFGMRDSFHQIRYILNLLGCCLAAVACCTRLWLSGLLVLDLVYVKNNFSLEGLQIHEAREEAARFSAYGSIHAS